MGLKKGDYVVVKKGIKDPDSEDFEIGGWQGRILGINYMADNLNLEIEWDSLTLKQMPDNFIHQSEVDGLDWQIMVLSDTDVDKAEQRDIQSDVKKMQRLLADKFCWSSLGDEGLRISQVFEGVNSTNEMECFQKWLDYLEPKLTFPIQAKVSESESDRFFKDGDRVTILSLSGCFDMIGILVSINAKNRKSDFKLSDLEVVDKKSSNYQLISDYKVWFANY